jgi:predicted ribonuclease YlaK
MQATPTGHRDHYYLTKGQDKLSVRVTRLQSVQHDGHVTLAVVIGLAPNA